MPVCWGISDGLVRITSVGDVSFEDWRAAVNAALSDAEYRPGMGVVHDWRGLHRPPSVQEIRSRGDYAARVGAIRWALVVQNEASYGMARMAEILADLLAGTLGIELRVFRGRAEAAAWAKGGE